MGTALRKTTAKGFRELQTAESAPTVQPNQRGVPYESCQLLPRGEEDKDAASWACSGDSLTALPREVTERQVCHEARQGRA